MSVLGQLDQEVERAFFEQSVGTGSASTPGAPTGLGREIGSEAVADRLRTVLPKAMASSVLRTMIWQYARRHGEVLPESTVEKDAEGKLRAYETKGSEGPALPSGETPREALLSPRALRAEQQTLTVSDEWKVIAGSGSQEDQDRRLAHWLKGRLAGTAVSISGVPGVGPGTLPKAFLARTSPGSGRRPG